MQIKNVQVFGLESSIIRSGYPHQICEPTSYTEMGVKQVDMSLIPKEVLDKGSEEVFNYISKYNLGTFISAEESGKCWISEHQKERANKLANTPIGSGHNNFLKGIIVQFDLKYPQYFTPQLQRYHWIDIISSQSKMHKLLSVKDISKNCNKYVLSRFYMEINNLIKIYNESTFPMQLSTPNIINIKSKEEMFHYIISNLPMGYELWMGISTNYLQLKTIYNQRKNHKLEEWRFFCDWIKTLPMSILITNE